MANYDIESAIQLAMQKGPMRLILIIGIIVLLFLFTRPWVRGRERHCA